MLKMLNVVKNAIFGQSLIKAPKSIKCLTKVLSKHLKHSNVWPKHLKQSTLKSYVMDPEQNASDQKYEPLLF